MSKSSEKKGMIIRCAIQILSTDGMAGLTMRKVSGLAGISLSNLQYYFPSMDVLIVDVINSYFEWCLSDIQIGFEKKEGQTDRAFVSGLLQKHLITESIDTRCTMFREIWALAARKPAISKALKSYYRNYTVELTAMFTELTSLSRLSIALLLPYIEGYSIMGNALSFPKQEIIDMLVTKVLEVSDS